MFDLKRFICKDCRGKVYYEQTILTAYSHPVDIYRCNTCRKIFEKMPPLNAGQEYI